ncbi:ABC transporter G family member 28-like [Dioscorea cayenensis subsp. rotundata]|uniref:ABC transporter G family member 28-like n=1 Tax=Dioscorea cayennensis subsp. rotundata TaxID=55577 RepID=A0AB40BAJ5_DIOCR|nr:ABC transporter G family member 28-like [Dioscorea cayenensis subsp. rotundata]
MAWWTPHIPFAILLFAILFMSPLPLCQGQDDDNDLEAGQQRARANPLFARVVYERLMGLTTSFVDVIGDNLNFCVKDSETDWNQAFNFSKDLTFLSNCIKNTDGDLTLRMCTAAEMKFYFASFENQGKSDYLTLNKNCNLTSWVSGCEPGWACSVGEKQKINLKDTKLIPSRTLNCKPCCEGFFCPHGMTCMIPCPLGTYCPTAKLNKTTGVCEPYRYQIPPGQPNHTCGGADKWADFDSSSEIFCPAGYYCPSTIKKLSCRSGYYCRKGSIEQNICYKKSSCKPNSENQDITIFGGFIIAALSLLLIVIYNFSGQLLTNREKKQAKSREAAARMARETVQARERWKSAKDIAKKHAVGLQSQFSRTFSRKKSVKQDMPPLAPKKEPSNLTKMIRSLEEDHEGDEGFNLEIGDKNMRKMTAKQMHTRSQIFKYAYGQIEKEKAMQQQNTNLTFSGVISMATDNDMRQRPVIEVAFKDLTLTLKGSKKKLMRSVTGKLMPGRVTALMGPSGAGKTTFLNALAGKATGCDMSGLVLINGKVEPIRAYKKIIGFVPQDDIVHGNLTVEENLWFSARCRLSADILKADKVLVVERVIESLGLQAVRDSLVGTVEQRGISGGQRKRVNVGLEMVMEPSLLILDEPTSGLDSSSSLLLMRALRREALEGVNICTVVHQPSYALFRMFDDLILLAKGGLIAYLGSVKKVEEYFQGLGIVVPERINPPDHYIDILEGIVKPSTSTGINYQQLPLRWMLHNGYDVPRDMLHEASDTSLRNGDAGSVKGGSERQSLTSDVWDNVKDFVQFKRDDFEYNFSKSKDLSNRRTPGPLTQYKYYLGRVGKQRLREARLQGVDFLILCLAGICLGTLAKMSDETFGYTGYLYTVIAVSLLCKIGALRSFTLDKLQYWRERASGMSSLAYFLSKDTIDHFNTAIKPLVYLSMFYFFNNPRSSFGMNYLILVSLVYCVTGIGYTFAICFQPSSAQLWSALLPVVLSLIASEERVPKPLTNLCYTKWALQAFVLANAERYSGVWLLTRCGFLKMKDYNIHEFYLCIVVLILGGIVFRCVAFFCLVTLQKR